MTKPTFFDWFDGKSAAAAQTEIGKRMIAAGFSIEHMGGGCLAWQKPLGETTLLVCDEGQGLGDTLDELYLVGQHTEDGDVLAEARVNGLEAALDWCAVRRADALGMH